LEWTKQAGGKVEILLVEINFNKGGKPDARKEKRKCYS
jgi:hypothetical protein